MGHALATGACVPWPPDSAAGSEAVRSRLRAGLGFWFAMRISDGARTFTHRCQLSCCLRSACRAKNTSALQTHALPRKFAASLTNFGLLPQGNLGSPSEKLSPSPWEEVATAHPSGKHVPHPADKFTQRS